MECKLGVTAGERKWACEKRHAVSLFKNMSLFRPALAPLLRSPPLVRSYAEALSAPSSTSAPPAGFRKPKLFDEFQYDETTSTGHQLIQKERDALAFMRTVELELPKLTRPLFSLFFAFYSRGFLLAYLCPCVFGASSSHSFRGSQR